MTPVGPGWKPTRCADCGRRHPSFSRNGSDGPWRCLACDAAIPAPTGFPSAPEPATQQLVPAQPFLL